MNFDETIPWNLRLKLIRTRLQLTQEQMAEKLDVLVRAYQRWEVAENVPSRLYRKQIAEKLDIDENILFFNLPVRTSPNKKKTQ